ncbi:hypothetical protein P3T29_003089 [Kitasatospora sp. MAP5-34]|nr:hypothetical protein [Kitasatospora sp. MAP5-34]
MTGEFGGGLSDQEDQAGPAGAPAWGFVVSDPPPAPRRERGWRGRRAWVAGVLGLVLTVVAGLGVWQPWHDTPAPNWTPFYFAMENLLDQPVAHYSGSAPDGATTWDLRVTSGGETLGTVTVAGQQISVLTVGDKTYVKPPAGLLAGLPAGVSASAVQGKWITGDDSLTGLLPAGLGSPADLASELWAALDATTAFPPVGTPAVKVGADPALAVTTPAGVLVVSATAPYRVLRFAPTPATTPGTGSSPSLHSARAPGASSHPAVQAAWSRLAASGDVPAGLAALGETDFQPVSPAEADQTYGDLIGQTKTLNSAVDIGVSFSFNQTGNLNCSESGCTVTENVATSTTSTRAAKLSGTVTAVMSATVTVNGQAAGGCMQTEALPINGNGTISCADPGVAGPVQQIKAEKQQEADQQAQASGQSVSIPYTLDYEAEVRIQAMAAVQAEIDQEVGAEQAERNTAAQTANKPTSCAQNSFLAGTRVLMADGTTVPIQDVKVGDRIDNAVPGSRPVAAHTVTAVQVTDSDRDFVQLAISAPGGTGEIDSTAHHLFYDATTGAWTDAADLKPGDRLQTTGDGFATVGAVRAYTAADRTYNLTVDGVHTYYVLAGATPILVHNDDYPGVGTIVSQDGVTIQIYSNDHGPAHAHVKGRGAEVRIGQNGKPLAGNPELSKQQQQVVDENIKTIRGNIRAAMARFAANRGC